MGQLVAEHDPPVHERLASLPGLVLAQALQMQLLEEAEVAEETTLPVEGDGTASLIVVDVQGTARQGEDLAAVDQQAGKDIQRRRVRRQKARPIRQRVGQEDLEPGSRVGDQGHVLARPLVAVGARLRDVGRVGPRVQVGAVVGARRVDGRHEILSQSVGRRHRIGLWLLLH